MNRRRFLLASLLSLGRPRPAAARGADKVHRVGMLETRSLRLNAANVDAFRKGMRELGYRDGGNLEIVYRSSDGRDERFPDLARELVGLDVDVIVTRGTPAALAAKASTSTIPIVMAASGDPVGAGIVPSLAHPGGNITGLSSGITESFPKRVELLRELLPSLKRLGAIFNMGNRVVPPQWTILEKSATSLGIEAHLLDVRRPEDLPRAFDTAVQRRVEAVSVGLDGVTQANLRPIADRAAQHRLPSIYPARDYAKAGGLMTYGSSDFHMYHRAATFTHKILAGARPADLPVEQPTKYELVINLRTARSFGLAIAPSLLLRAEEVIE